MENGKNLELPADATGLVIVDMKRKDASVMVPA